MSGLRRTILAAAIGALLAPGPARAATPAPSIDASSAADSLRVLRPWLREHWQAEEAGDSTSLALADLTVDLARRVDGAASRGLALSYLDRGACREIASDYAGAAEDYDAAARLLADLDPADAQLPVVLARAGNVARIEGAYARADSLLDLAFAAPAASSTDDATRSEWWRYRSRLRVEEGDLDAAAEAAAQSLESARLSGSEAAVGLGRMAVGLVEQRKGELTAARDSYAGAVQSLVRSRGEENLDVADALMRYGNTLRRLGEFVPAREALRRAQRIVEAKLGADNDYMGTLLSALANLASKEGEFDEARRLLERLLEQDRRQFGDDHPYVADDLNNLGGTYFLAGRAEQALPLLERALHTYRAAFGDDDFRVGRTRVNLAPVLHHLGRWDEADRAFREGIAQLEASVGEEDERVAFGRSRYGAMLLERGALGEARRELQHALQTFETVLGTSHPETATALHELARVDMAEGAWAAARGKLEEALARRRAMFRGPHPDVAANQLDLARVARHESRDDDAFRQALAAERSSREHARVLLAGASERNALHYAQNRVRGLGVAHEALRALDDSARDAALWDEVVRSRSLVYDEMAGRAWIAHRGDGEMGDTVEALRRARRRLADLALQGPSPGDAGAWADKVAAARIERERAEEELAARSRSYARARRGEDQGLEPVLAALPYGAALVAYAVLADESAGPQVVAFVADPDRRVARFELGSLAAVDEAVESWRRELLAGVGAVGPLASRAEARYREAAGRLRELVWDPLAGSVGAADLVLLVADGPLLGLSFAALPDPEGGYLVDDERLLHLLTSERDVLTLARETRHGQAMLAVGGADFGGEGDGAASARGNPDCPSLGELRFDPLPGSADEAREIAELWSGPDGARADVRVGVDATELAFRELAPSRGALHLATHGYFVDPECGGWGREVAASRSVPRLQEAPRDPALLSPLLLTGLALAGANRGDEADRPDDGLLSAEEIVALDLGAADWVVLSACDTGRGEVVVGEGVRGLRRAFRTAGARTVVASLWPVDDHATREWMQSLYRARRVDGLSTAAAMREATLRFRQRREEAGRAALPFTWAAFVAAGAWD